MAVTAQKLMIVYNMGYRTTWWIWRINIYKSLNGIYDHSLNQQCYSDLKIKRFYGGATRAEQKQDRKML